MSQQGKWYLFYDTVISSRLTDNIHRTEKVALASKDESSALEEATKIWKERAASINKDAEKARKNAFSTYIITLNNSTGNPRIAYEILLKH